MNTNNHNQVVKSQSAGGIIIDPWNNIDNPNKYNILIIKQRHGNNWGLPKGHCESDETLEECAIREIREETGINIYKLTEGIDYLKIKTSDLNQPYYNKKVIKRIHFFVYLLLKIY